MRAKKKANTSKYLLKIEKYTVKPESNLINVGTGEGLMGGVGACAVLGPITIAFILANQGEFLNQFDGINALLPFQSSSA